MRLVVAAHDLSKPEISFEAFSPDPFGSLTPGEEDLRRVLGVTLDGSSDASTLLDALKPPALGVTGMTEWLSRSFQSRKEVAGRLKRDAELADGSPFSFLASDVIPGEVLKAAATRAEAEVYEFDRLKELMKSLSITLNIGALGTKYGLGIADHAETVHDEIDSGDFIFPVPETVDPILAEWFRTHRDSFGLKSLEDDRRDPGENTEPPYS